MKPARGFTAGAALVITLGAGFLPGCATPQSDLERALHSESSPEPTVAECYLLYCPDVLDVRVERRSDLTGLRPVGADGCIDGADGERLRVEGHTAPDCERLLAIQAGVSPSGVRVRVAEFNSQRVCLLGQVKGRQRSLPYQGPETVLGMLRRAGGVTPGASGDVTVVRPRVAEGKPPEVYRLELRSLVKTGDPQNRFRVQASDQIHIGETYEWKLRKCIAPCLRPFYQAWCNVFRSPAPPAKSEVPKTSEPTSP